MEKRSLPTIISSNRITLKKHSKEIAKEMFDFIDQDRKRLRECLPWVDSTNTVQDEIHYIEFTHKQWNTNEFFD